MKFKNSSPVLNSNIILSNLLLLSEKRGYPNVFRKRYYDDYSDYYGFVFLCGGNYMEFVSRDTLANILKRNKGIQIIISEELQELRGKLDLFSFEIVLEAISKMVLISLESMGTACELGAFTNSHEMNKEVVIVDERFKNDLSFINKGPIEYLKNINLDRVIYSKYGTYNGKKTVVVNSEISNLPNHSLINEPMEFTKCFSLDNEYSPKQLTISNLTTFTAYVLDYFFTFYFGNIDSFIQFLKKTNKVNNVAIDASGLKGKETMVRNVVETLLNIYVRTEFLIKKDDYYYVDLINVNKKSHSHDWTGHIIFVNEFTKSNDYKLLRIKALNAYRRLLC